MLIMPPFLQYVCVWVFHFCIYNGVRIVEQHVDFVVERGVGFHFRPRMDSVIVRGVNGL